MEQGQAVSVKLVYLSDYRTRERFIHISISRARSDQTDEGVRVIVEEVKREVGDRW